MTVDNRITSTVLSLLKQRSVSKSIDPDDDLREAGLSSMDMLNLVLAVESEFDLMIPENAITPANFRTITAISSLVQAMTGTAS